MEKAIVLMHHPNGMPAMHADPNLRAGDIDLGRTFNAMREKQRKHKDLSHTYWAQQVNVSNKAQNNQWSAK